MGDYETNHNQMQTRNKRSRPHDFQSSTVTSHSSSFLYLSFSISPGNFHILALWLSLSELTAKCFCLAILCLKQMGSTGDVEADWECAEHSDGQSPGQKKIIIKKEVDAVPQY